MEIFFVNNIGIEESSLSIMQSVNFIKYKLCFINLKVSQRYMKIEIENTVIVAINRKETKKIIETKVL